MTISLTRFRSGRTVAGVVVTATAVAILFGCAAKSHRLHSPANDDAQRRRVSSSLHVVHVRAEGGFRAGFPIGPGDIVTTADEDGSIPGAVADGIPLVCRVRVPDSEPGDASGFPSAAIFSSEKWWFKSNIIAPPLNLPPGLPLTIAGFRPSKPWRSQADFWNAPPVYVDVKVVDYEAHGNIDRRTAWVAAPIGDYEHFNGGPAAVNDRGRLFVVGMVVNRIIRVRMEGKQVDLLPIRMLPFDVANLASSKPSPLRIPGIGHKGASRSGQKAAARPAPFPNNFAKTLTVFHVVSESVRGSGFPIDDRRIITAAHGVEDALGIIGVEGSPAIIESMPCRARGHAGSWNNDWATAEFPTSPDRRNRIDPDVKIQPGDKIVIAGHGHQTSDLSRANFWDAPPSLVEGRVVDVRPWRTPPPGVVFVEVPSRDYAGFSGGPAAIIDPDGAPRVWGMLLAQGPMWDPPLKIRNIAVILRIPASVAGDVHKPPLPSP